jgi:hypothetical protein
MWVHRALLRVYDHPRSSLKTTSALSLCRSFRHAVILSGDGVGYDREAQYYAVDIRTKGRTHLSASLCGRVRPLQDALLTGLRERQMEAFMIELTIVVAEGREPYAIAKLRLVLGPLLLTLTHTVNPNPASLNTDIRVTAWPCTRFGCSALWITVGLQSVLLHRSRRQTRRS